MVLIVILLGILLYSFLVWAWNQYYTRTLMSAAFPGPPRGFFVGSASDFMGDKGMLRVFQDYQKEYGDLVYTRVGPSINILLFSDPRLVRKVFQSNMNLTKGNSYNFTERWLQHGLLTTPEEKWSDQRKMLQPAFNMQILNDYLPTFEEQAEILIENIDKLLPSNSINIQRVLSLCSLDIICETSMGVSLGAQENQNTEYVKAVKEMCRIIAARSCSLWKSMGFFYLFSKDYRSERRCLEILNNYTKKVIRQRREIFSNKRKRELAGKRNLNLLDMLLYMSISKKIRSEISENQIKAEVHTFMFAGHDTVTAAMSFFVYELAKHRDVQEILFEEQQAIFGHDKDAPISSMDLARMKNLDMCMKETMRLYPPVPVYTRKVTKEFEFEGKTIPKGVTLTHFAFGLHRNHKYFEDPNTFNYLRFSDPNNIEPYTFNPFSCGPRNCIGQKFAICEMKVILSKMIRTFEFHPAIPKHRLDLRAEVVLTSRNGIHVSLVKRDL